MLKATFQPGPLFKNAIDAIKDLCEEANFSCSESGISCTTMDSSHVALIKLTLPKEEFAEYECGTARTFGVSVLSLAKLLKIVPSTATVQLIHIAGGDVVRINVFVGESLVQEFVVRLMDIDQEDFTIPEKLHAVQIKAPSAELKSIINSLKEVGENIRIVCSAETEEVVFSAEGDVGSASHRQKYPMVFGEGVDGVSNMYSAVLLQKFTKAAVLSDKVIISQSPYYPVVLEYMVGSRGRIKYYLAPKEEQPDENS